MQINKISSLRFLSVLVLIVFSKAAFAQDHVFSLSTDPFVPVLGGYHAEVAYKYKKNRIAFSASAIDVPPFYNTDSDNFDIERNHVDIAITRFLSSGLDGWHLGLSVGYVYENKIISLDTEESIDEDFMRAGVRVGYIWRPFKKKSGSLSRFYIEPGVHASVALGAEDHQFSNQTFEKQILSISGPIVHIGYLIF